MSSLPRVIAVIVATCTGAGIAAADNTIPRFFDFKIGGEIVWMAATEAITESGTLRIDVPRPGHLKSELREWHEAAASRKSVATTATAADSCDIRYGHLFAEGPDDGAITSEAVLNELIATRSVINGTVSAYELGIHFGIPHTILQIDQNGDGGSARRVYLLFPRGRLRFDGVTFCNEDPTVGGIPSVGDPIMFIASDPIDSTGTLYSTSWIVYEHESAVISSHSFRLEPDARPQSVEGFSQRLRLSQQRDRRQ